VRDQTRTVLVGSVAIGGGNPVVVQSMTDTDTADIDRTVAQVNLLADAGSEIVRITVNNADAARAVPEIKKQCDVPLVGDFHFIGHKLLKEIPACAEALDKFRINPGNVGRKNRRDENFEAFIEVARDLNKPVRIGVNAGSLDPELLAEKMDENAKLPEPLSGEEVEKNALVESALRSAEAASALGVDDLILSCKVSRLPLMVSCYRELSERTDYPLHLGLTEAGMGLKGEAATTSALSILLHGGIGDTIRSSLTPAVGGDRAREVRLCQEILQALGLRSFRPAVTACPGCGRTTSTLFRELAADISNHLEQKLPEWRTRHPGSETLNVAVMGCVVNGPGESRAADIGISLPGSGEEPRAPVYVDGERKLFLTGATIAEDFIAMVERYVEGRWGA
jgi:(E)-4-hydroxy-3-methylbut-2-enyl-diphosphate synthase